MLRLRSCCFGFALLGMMILLMLCAALNAQQTGPIILPLVPPRDKDAKVPHFVYHGLNIGKVTAAKQGSATAAANKNPLEQAVDAYLKAITPPQSAARTTLAWINFTKEMSTDKEVQFPKDECDSVVKYRAVPFISLVTPGRCDILKDGKLNDKWGPNFEQWGKDARPYLVSADPTAKERRALMITFAPGCNGGSSCWKKHPNEFTIVFKAIQDAIKKGVSQADKAANDGKTNSADNIIWVLQIEVPDGATPFESFYPKNGEFTVTWIGVNVFGAVPSPADASQADSSGDATNAAGDSKKVLLTPLPEQLARYFFPPQKRLLKIASDKRIIISAFGCPDTLDARSVRWTQEALDWIAGPNAVIFPQIIGFSWLNSAAPFSYCVTDCSAKGGNAVSLKLQTNSIVARAFARFLDPIKVVSEPAFTSSP